MERKVKADEPVAQAAARVPMLSGLDKKSAPLVPPTPAHADLEGVPAVPGRRWTRSARTLFRSDRFNEIVCALVVLNAISMAAKVDAEVGTWHYAVLNTIEHVFGLVFLVEALAKAAAFGAKDIMASRTLKFEFVIAIVGALDLFVIDFRHFGLINEDTGVNVLPLLRLVRFTQVFRHGELQLISRCFFAAWDTMMHITLFLFLIIFIFAIPTVKLIGQNPIYDDNFYNIRTLFGTVPHAWWGLMQMVVNPDIFMMQNLFEKQPWTPPFVLFFLGITTYTTVSIMFGCVTDQYAKYSEQAREEMGRAESEKNEQTRMVLLEELQEADEQQKGLRGALNKEEFSKRFDSPSFQGSLKSLGVDEGTCQELLDMLEVDGHVYYKEFVQALDLVGKDAQATQVLWLRAHMAEDLKKMEARMDNVTSQLADYQKAFVGLEQTLSKRIDNGFAALRAVKK